MDAITGNPAGIGPTGLPDPGGGQQPGADGAPAQQPQQSQQPQQPQQATTPQADAVQTAEVATGPFSPAEQPTVAGPTGFQPSGGMPVNAQTLQKMMAGQMYGPTGVGSSTVPEMSPGAVAMREQPGFVAQDFADVQQPSQQPQQPPDWLQNTVQNLHDTGGQMGGATPETSAPATTSDATSQDGDTQPSKQARSEETSPPTQGGVPTTSPSSTQQPGVSGQGGFPGAGGLGNIVQDILGIMSGNPQSLMGLVQDVARMGGAGGLPAALQQLTGGGMRGGGGQIATQGPYAGRPINQIPWTPGYGPSTGRYRAPPGTMPPTQGGGQNAPRGAPPGAGGPPRAVATQRVPAAGLSGQPLPGPQGSQGIAGQRQPGFQRNGAPAAPSRRPDGTMPTGRTAVTPIIASTLRASGASNNAIRGILFNVGSESSFNPSSVTREDQANHPQFRGTEANHAHGLYQEGGDEWNNYARWLNGRDWRDPKLQTQFLAANLKRNYPKLWMAMNNARTPEDAAKLFARDYLKPSSPNLAERYNRINRGGVQRYTVPAERPTAPPPPPPPAAAPPSQTPPQERWMQPSQGIAFTQQGDPSTFGGESYAGMSPSDDTSGDNDTSGD
jgi:hypothetical protein